MIRTHSLWFEFHNHNLQFFFSLQLQNQVTTMMMNDNKLFLPNGWSTQNVKSYFQLWPFSLSQISEPASRIWTCKESSVNFCWIYCAVVITIILHKYFTYYMLKPFWFSFRVATSNVLMFFGKCVEISTSWVLITNGNYEVILAVLDPQK